MRFLSATFARILAIIGMAFSLSSCSYNSLVRLDENVTAAWAEVLNQYKSRADLAPQLINTVKGYAAHEEEIFLKVTEARSKLGSIQVDPAKVPNDATMKQFMDAQRQMGAALGRLIAVAENYPDLKSNQNFLDLQRSLEERENRVNVARKGFIDAVRDYNVRRRQFPANITAALFNFEAKPTIKFEDEQEIAKPPVVQF